MQLTNAVLNNNIGFLVCGYKLGADALVLTLSLFALLFFQQLPSVQLPPPTAAWRASAVPSLWFLG